MSEKKVIDLSFELRREFALGNVGKYIPNLVHLIPTITKYKPQKRKNGKFCFGCFEKVVLNQTSKVAIKQNYMYCSSGNFSQQRNDIALRFTPLELVDEVQDDDQKLIFVTYHFEVQLVHKTLWL